jgi:hypothetical protein
MTSSRSISKLLPAFGLALAVVAGFAAPLRATSVVLPSDRSMLRRADLVVLATVREKLPSSPRELRPMTDHWVEVDRVLKGDYPGSALVLRTLGGDGTDGMTLKIWGVPEFGPGEPVLLFLRADADGTYRLLHTVLGAFRRATVAGREVAYRDLSDVDVLSSADQTEEGLEPQRKQRDFALFVDWLVDEAAGHRRVPDYFFRTPEASMNYLAPMFSLLTEGGRPMRWFEFDSNRSISWRIDARPLPGFSGNVIPQFQNALAAWNNEARTPIRYNYAGTSNDQTGFTDFDGENVLLFDDPNGDVEETFNCSEGGTLAIGGPWFSSRNTGRFNNETFIRIQGADIVFNDGLDCFFQRSNAAAAAELIGHELGHTLGLSHSSESASETNATLRDALMFFRIHNDGRGASLRSDDLAGIRRLYQSGSGGGGGGGGNGNCPQDTLCLLNGRFQVTATWDNQFNGTNGAAGAIRNTDLAGFLYFTDPNNIELIVKTLDFGDRVLFFYGQLTNLRFQIRVLDTRTGTTKTYANTSGDCGAIDNNLAPSATSLELVGENRIERSAVCVSNNNSACLINGRYQLELDWRNQFDNSTGRGIARRLSDLTAAFAFTDPANLEVLVKTLDFGDRVLVLYGTLSNLEYTLRITEVSSGVVKTYRNSAGNYCGGIDNNAF